MVPSSRLAMLALPGRGLVDLVVSELFLRLLSYFGEWPSNLLTPGATTGPFTQVLPLRATCRAVLMRLGSLRLPPTLQVVCAECFYGLWESLSPHLAHALQVPYQVIQNRPSGSSAAIAGL